MGRHGARHDHAWVRGLWPEWSHETSLRPNASSTGDVYPCRSTHTHIQSLNAVSPFVIQLLNSIFRNLYILSLSP
ncbi:unnamed protein product [Jaminaea pallidilutea]